MRFPRYSNPYAKALPTRGSRRFAVSRTGFMTLRQAWPMGRRKARQTRKMRNAVKCYRWNKEAGR